MAIMRSDMTKNTGGASWLGVKNASLKTITDDSAKFDWADVYLQLEFEVADSKYTRPCQIKGSFEKNPDGTIQDCPLLKRMTYAFDALGFQGGVNQKGEWVDADENPISDIAAYLTDAYCHPDTVKEEYVIYVYKELAKNGKVYTRVHTRFLAMGAGAEEELVSYTDYLKSKGYLKEADENQTNGAAVDNLHLEGLDVASL
jgi:hypothetical protein